MKHITKYQLEVLTHMLEIEKTTGKYSDMNQVLEKLSWEPSKESFHFTIRAMVQKDFIAKMPVETRRKRNRVCFSVLKEGKAIFDPRDPLPGFLSISEVSLPEVPDFSESLES